MTAVGWCVHVYHMQATFNHSIAFKKKTILVFWCNIQLRLLHNRPSCNNHWDFSIFYMATVSKPNYIIWSNFGKYD